MEFAGIALIRKSQVLLCKRSPDMEKYPNVWSVPAGHVEEGEKPEDCAVRELMEETHIPIGGEIKLAGVIDKVDGMFYLYYTEIPEFHIPMLDMEHVDYGYYKMDNLPHPMDPDMIRLLKKIVK
mgnify:FL=1|tara:strand:+ start:1374 stop:1745 length:372 start_codon:yes stop_codon:yes gene_type:complete